MLGLDSRVLRMVYTLCICYLVYLLRDVLLLLVLSVVAAYMLLPAVEFAYRFATHRKHRAMALAIVFVSILTVLLVIGGVIGFYAFQEASSLTQQIPSLMDPDAIQHLKFPKILQPWDAHIRQLIQNWEATHGKDLLETLSSVTMKILTALGSVLSILVILVLSYLLLKNPDGYSRAFLRLVPEEYQHTAQSFLHDMHKMMKQWTRAIVLGALGTVILYGIAFSLLRVPYSILLAMMAFPFEFVPLIGPPVAFGIILLVAFFSGYHHLLWLVGIFVVVRLLGDYVLQPMLMSSGDVELPPFVVIVGALVGEAIGGVPGLLLSIPIIATVRLLYRHLRAVELEPMMRS